MNNLPLLAMSLFAGGETVWPVGDRCALTRHRHPETSKPKRNKTKRAMQKRSKRANRR